MTITMHAYDDADLHRLQDTLAHWVHDAGECGYYHPGNIVHRVYEGFSGIRPYRQLVHLWEEGGDIVGFTYSFVFNSAFFAFVAPQYRGTAVELTILRNTIERTERLMAETQQEEKHAITDVYDCDQIRVDLLRQLGFEHYRTWDWITKRSLTDPIPMPPAPEGFAVRPATMADAEGLASIRNSAFGGSWTAEAYRNQVMTAPGYRPEHEIVAVAPDGRIAAFAVIRLDIVNKVGLFEPVGTHYEFRRLGLARAVMARGLEEMHHHGMMVASVEHTAENEPALALYQSLGFVKNYETWGFRRA